MSLKYYSEFETGLCMERVYTISSLGWLTVVLWKNRVLKWAFGHQIVLAVTHTILLSKCQFQNSNFL